MGLKADIVKALQVSLDKDDSEHLATEIMDRLPPVYAAAPEMLKCLKEFIRDVDAVSNGDSSWLLSDWPDLFPTYEMAVKATAKGEKP